MAAMAPAPSGWPARIPRHRPARPAHDPLGPWYWLLVPFQWKNHKKTIGKYEEHMGNIWELPYKWRFRAGRINNGGIFQPCLIAGE